MSEQIFVAREQEIARLNTFLDQTLAGHGQVCFVTGEAGAGKTALVTEFARRAQVEHDDLLVAIGDCNAQTGIGDPYLPFREVLGLLTGDVEVKLAQGAITQENAGRLQDFLRVSGQALVEYGPDLIDIFVPGGALATRMAGKVAQRTGWLGQLEDLTQRRAQTADQATHLDQSHIFEQYTAVLKALATQRSLILVVDDLQWADTASIGLLFHLSRRLQDSRILLVGAYRPDDVVLGRGAERHPLEPVLNELKRYYGDIWVDLGQGEETEGRQFVDALLDSEPNWFGDPFRQALYQHTGGHPLFTVELLRNLQERGDLIQDEQGRWVEGLYLEWDTLPARVEGVIEERVGRLEDELREALTVASVEGEDFTAEVVAHVQSIDERGLIRSLSRELDKQHRLVNARGMERLGRQRLSLYRFRHNLFQKYLYNNLDEIERSLLHEDVGRVLEGLYGDQAETIAVQLAWHFLEAGLDAKALAYLVQAAERAARSYAHQEAGDLYRQAIVVAQRLDVPGPDLISLYSARGRVLEHAGRYDEAVGVYRALEELAQEREDKEMEGAAISRLVTCYAEPTEMHSPKLAKPLIERGLVLAREIGDHDLELWLLWSELVWANHYGMSAEAQAAGKASIAIAREHNLQERLAFVLNDLAINLRLSGNPEQGQAYAGEARALFQQMGNRPMLADNLSQQAWSDYHQLKFESAIHCVDQCITISEEINNPWNLSLATMVRGQVRAALGNWGPALADFEESIRIGEQAGFVFALTLMPAELGQLLREIGQIDRAWSLHKQAHRVSERRAPFLLRALESQLAVDAFVLGQVDEGHRWLQAVRTREPRGAIGTAWGVLAYPAIAVVHGAEHTGDWASALQAVEGTIEEAKRRRLPIYLPRLIYEHGRCLVGLERAAEAETRFRETIAAAGNAGLRPVKWLAHAALSRLYAAQNRPTEAETECKIAVQIVQEIADSFNDLDQRDGFLATPAVQSLING